MCCSSPPIDHGTIPVGSRIVGRGLGRTSVWYAEDHVALKTSAVFFRAEIPVMLSRRSLVHISDAKRSGRNEWSEVMRATADV